MTAPTEATATSAQQRVWRNRIVGSGEADPRELVPNPQNWRLHPKRQLAALSGSLTEVGWVQQVLVNRRTGHVVDGHARIELALARGEPTVPVLYVDLSPEEERLVLATLDPIGAMADADGERLRSLVEGVTVDDVGLARLLDALGGARPGAADPDELPPEEGPVNVRPGDLWVLGDHRLVCGDATKPEVALLAVGDAKPRLLVTDPPYGVSYDPTWRATLNPGRVRATGERQRPAERPAIYGDERADWSDAYALVPSLQVAYVWHAALHASEVAAGIQRIGFEIICQIIWDKGVAVISHAWYNWAHEPCWVARRPGITGLWLGTRDQGTIWRVPSPRMGAGAERHPAQKPVELYEAPIRNHLELGEWLYDPFAGSGTSVIAAERLGRRCAAVEIEPRYVQLTIDRWERYTGRQAELAHRSEDA